MALVRRATVTAALDPAAFAGELERCVDPIPERFGFAARFERQRPYVGRVEADAFTVRKRTGQPWDHFSPLVNGTLRRSGHELEIDYQMSKITGLWLLARIFVAIALLAFVSTAGYALLEFRDGAELGALAPWAAIAVLSIVTALGMVAVIRIGAISASNDAAELDLLIRNAVRDAERSTR